MSCTRLPIASQLATAGEPGPLAGGIVDGYVFGRAASACNSWRFKNAKKNIKATWLKSAMNHTAEAEFQEAASSVITRDGTKIDWNAVSSGFMAVAP